jgi:hypothetical protein
MFVYVEISRNRESSVHKEKRKKGKKCGSWFIILMRKVSDKWKTNISPGTI